MTERRWKVDDGRAFAFENGYVRIIVTSVWNHWISFEVSTYVWGLIDDDFESGGELVSLEKSPGIQLISLNTHGTALLSLPRQRPNAD
jgi:hypothetical protein